MNTAEQSAAAQQLIAEHSGVTDQLDVHTRSEELRHLIDLHKADRRAKAGIVSTPTPPADTFPVFAGRPASDRT